MSAAALYRRRTDLRFSGPDEEDQYVVKDPASRDYYRIGSQEKYLLDCFDGQRSPEAVRLAFQQRFSTPLSADDFVEFTEMARSQGFLEVPVEQTPKPAPLPELPPPPPPSAPARSAPAPRQSVLRWRQNLFDPDRFFNWLLPKIGFFWTPAFFVFSLVGILGAGLVVCSNGEELVSTFARSFRWETFAIVWATLLILTVFHEFAHGLTCKRFGGEVHEVGFLVIFFMPSLYCNVSDAWLIRERWKRLLVTFAGGYCDLMVWALAVFTWRLAAPAGFLNYLAWVVLTVVGARIFLNLNPLVKLDGYYLLSDYLGVPNLQERSMRYLIGRCRWLLWGDARPEPEARPILLAVYGVASLSFGLVFISMTVVGLLHYFGDRWGLPGVIAVLALAVVVMRSLLGGFVEGAFGGMLANRRSRLLGWSLLAVLALIYSATGRTVDHASGGFQLRPVVRVEVRAPVAGFLQVIEVDEASAVEPGTVLARLNVPNLTTRLAQSKAEVREAEARIRLLQAGPKGEELAAQEKRVERARLWVKNSIRDLAVARKAHEQDLEVIGQQIAQQNAEAAFASDVLDRMTRLVRSGALSVEAYQDAQRRYQVATAQLGQTKSQGRVREIAGVREAELEVARRERDLAEAEAALKLLSSGPKSEEFDVEGARLERARQELKFLENLESSLTMTSPVRGVVATARLRERAGQYVHEGEVVCLVEQPEVLEAEMLLADQEVARVQEGQPVELKPRNAPGVTLHGKVKRISRRSVRGDAVSAATTVTAYCSIDEEDPARSASPASTAAADPSAKSSATACRVSSAPSSGGEPPAATLDAFNQNLNDRST
jgi:multidrug resistance efflux pump